jgi:hypothetical protein
LWRDRSRQAFCHSVRGWAVAAPPTKVEPPHCSSGSTYRRYRAVPPSSPALFRNQGSRSRRRRYRGVQCRYPDFRSLDREQRTAHCGDGKARRQCGELPEPRSRPSRPVHAFTDDQSSDQMGSHRVHPSVPPPPERSEGLGEASRAEHRRCKHGGWGQLRLQNQLHPTAFRPHSLGVLTTSCGYSCCPP